QIADNVSVLIGNGIGSFNTSNFPTGSGPLGVAVGDFNGDGSQDIATANYNSQRAVSVLLGTGLGTFGTPATINFGVTADAVAVGDFNGDGKQDLAVAGGDVGSMFVLLGNGLGSFGTPTS